VRVALEAMGGDLGVVASVHGAAQVSLEDGDLHVVLVGDLDAMRGVLREVRHDARKISLVGAEGAVAMGDDPRAALEKWPEGSILRAARLVRDGEADALVSAGHTGATVLAASRTFARIPGIRRAALAAVYPTEQRHGPHFDPFALMLDVGATVSATEDDLVGFAVMGAAYSSVISQIEAPRVALLSNGSEFNKGTPAIVGAHRRLATSPLNFAGNVEGLDIPRGTVDVVVCDGFLGNVVLKMLEGISDVAAGLARQASARSLQWRLGLSMLGGGLRELRRLTDWRVYGGAPLLGLDRVVIKAHGRSEARAMRNAIKVAAKAVRGDLLGKISDGAAAVRREGEE
jgi:glycerol-3-phosphate acyltransferase PlsX